MLRLAFAVLVLTSVAAAAQERSLGRSGMDNVYVWKDGDSLSEAYKLINSGVFKTNPSLIMRLLSCIADAGDKAVVTDGGFATSTIVVTSGDNAGCRGDIANEDLGG